MSNEWPRPGLVTLTEIAEFAGTGRPTVSNWRRRHPSFPAAVRADSVQPLFDADEIAAWLDHRQITRTGEPAEDGFLYYGARFRRNLRYQAFAMLRGILPGDRLLGAALALVSLFHLNDARRFRDADVQRIRELARQARRDLADEWSDLYVDVVDLPDAAEPLISLVADLVLDQGSEAADDRLMAMADRLGSSVRAHMTPPPVADVVAGMVRGLSACSVHDPAAGTGELLLRALARLHTAPGDAVPLAVEKDQAMARLLCHRLDHHHAYVDVVQADSLATGARRKYDLVVTEPPFVGGDPSLARRADTNPLVWAEYVAGRVSPSGAAYVIVPAWVLSWRVGHGDEDHVTRSRKRLIRSGSLSAVVQLPARLNTFRNAADLAVLVLRGDPREESDIAMCDMSTSAAESGEELGKWISQLLAEPELDRERCVPASPSDLVRTGFNLTPAVWLAADSKASRDWSPELRHAHQRLLETSRPRPPSIGFEFRHVSGWTTPKPLGMIPHLSIVPGQRIAAADITDASGDGYRVIGADEVAGRVPLGRRYVSKALAGRREAMRLTKPGDVIVVPTSESDAVIDDEGESIVLYPAQVVRITSSDIAITPRILATVLNAKTTWRKSGVHRVDLRTVPIPALSPADARRLDSVLADLERARGEAAEYLSAVTAVIDGLTSVALQEQRPDIWI